MTMCVHPARSGRPPDEAEISQYLLCRFRRLPTVTEVG